MDKDKNFEISGSGYTKVGGKQSAQCDMVLEGSSQVMCKPDSRGGHILLFVRVKEEKSLSRFQENEIDLTCEKARLLAKWLVDEADKVDRMIQGSGVAIKPSSA